RRAPRVVESVVRDLLWPVIEGKDPRDVSGLHDAMFATLRPWGHYRGFVQEGMSGIDQALWDIVAQAQGVPIYKALGGAARARVPVYGSKVYTAELDHMAREARAAVERGHKAIKVQVGRSAEWGGPAADVDVCRAIREAIGPGIEMGVDVNSAYDAATAIRVCHKVAKHDLWFIEEPVYPDDIDGYELIRRSQPIPVAAGESEFGLFGFRELLKRRALDVVQPEIARIGGFTAAMRLRATWLQVAEARIARPGGREIERFLSIRTRDFAAIVAVTEPPEVALIRSYKHGLRSVSLAVPAGYIEEGEDSLTSAKRELRE